MLVFTRSPSDRSGQEDQAGRGKGGGQGKGRGKGKGKGKRICSFFNNGGCQRGSACMFLHEIPAMAAKALEAAAPAAAPAAKKS